MGAGAKVDNGKGKSVYIYSGNVFTVVQYNTVWILAESGFNIGGAENITNSITELLFCTELDFSSLFLFCFCTSFVCLLFFFVHKRYHFHCSNTATNSKPFLLWENDIYTV